MRRANHLSDRSACGQARELAQSVYHKTFSAAFRAHTSLTDRLRRLTVSIANALDDARDDDARQVICACEGARRSVAELRETCRMVAVAELQEELQPIVEKCTHVEDAFVRLVRDMESGIDSRPAQS
jgi:four helix bundle protein